MNEALLQLNTMKANLEKLLRSYTAIKNENEILKNQIDAQRKAMMEKNQKVSEIEQQLSLLKTAQTISKQINSTDMETTNTTENEISENNHAVKLKINDLIKEVDKCISLLNA
ncbi:MAG: hypothetical protein H7Y00_12140 [Fimbriimonadaceae bacterium]|nr:hypothetical protein [Chitinophagales bacterium]